MSRGNNGKKWILTFFTPIPRFFPKQKSLVYYQPIKRELNRSLIYECRCDERLKAKVEGSTRLTYTGFRGGLEHLTEIEMRLIDERFASVMGECEIVTLKVRRLYLELYVKLPPWQGCCRIPVESP